MSFQRAMLSISAANVEHYCAAFLRTTIFFHLFGRLVKVMGVSNVCVCLLLRAYNTCCLADYCRGYTKKLDLSPVESDTCRIGRVAPVGDSHPGRYTGPAVLPHYPTSSAMILVYIYR